MEIIASAVFTECHNYSSGPNIAIFQRFQQAWKNINSEDYLTIEEELNEKEVIVDFCQNQLMNMNTQPRDDYREMLELAIIYLGGTPHRGIRFYKPGALHQARWMARVIYTIKICLFRSQFSMNKRELTAMQRFALFSVRVYIRAWFQAPLAAAAPSNDLSFLKQLISYEDKHISKAAVIAFSRHMWYLSEVLVSLAFFDPNIDVLMKRQMVLALSENESSGYVLKMINVEQELQNFGEKTVANFVTKASRRFFEILGIPSDFLAFDPEEWEGRPDYNACREVVRKLKVVNDFAERGVALMQEFNSILTKDEEQKQYVLQVVEEHRRKFPDAKKPRLELLDRE